VRGTTEHLLNLPNHPRT